MQFPTPPPIFPLSKTIFNSLGKREQIIKLIFKSVFFLFILQLSPCPWKYIKIAFDSSLSYILDISHSLIGREKERKKRINIHQQIIFPIRYFSFCKQSKSTLDQIHSSKGERKQKLFFLFHFRFSARLRMFSFTPFNWASSIILSKVERPSTFPRDSINDKTSSFF